MQARSRWEDVRPRRYASWLIIGVLIGCTPEDMGAKIERECKSVVAAAAREAEHAGPSQEALKFELRARGVVIPKPPADNENFDEKVKRLRAQATGKEAPEDPPAVAAYRAEWAKIRESDAYRAAYKAADEADRDKRVAECVSQRSRAFERGAR